MCRTKVSSHLQIAFYVQASMKPRPTVLIKFSACSVSRSPGIFQLVFALAVPEHHKRQEVLQLESDIGHAPKSRLTYIYDKQTSPISLRDCERSNDIEPMCGNEIGLEVHLQGVNSFYVRRQKGFWLGVNRGVGWSQWAYPMRNIQPPVNRKCPILNVFNKQKVLNLPVLKVIIH